MIKFKLMKKIISVGLLLLIKATWQTNNYIQLCTKVVLRSKVNMETGSRKQKFGGNRIRSN